ncbi:hypothetical protein PHMEG_00019203 [Phytophthora megakarya]|uniref:Uncharacterized protein n=1 Tax=Phytophthora megakarya TaxID=4795 RepID=A0A225VTM4_9STRA|nr:hypothetical protein PHMEG_00019203 [Phytophthora megakarya]
MSRRQSVLALSTAKRNMSPHARPQWRLFLRATFCRKCCQTEMWN